MPENLSGYLRIAAKLPSSPFGVRVGPPAKVLVQTADEERKGPYVLVGPPVVQVATQPVGPDAVELVWEVNDLIPYDGARYRSHTAAFTPFGQNDFLADKRFGILASLDGKDFTPIATVDGPANRYVHKGIEPNVVVYYRVRAYDASGDLVAESPVAMGAAGENLCVVTGYEDRALGPIPKSNDHAGGVVVGQDNALEIVEGHRPYSTGKRIMAVDPKRAGAKQVNVYSNQIPIAPGKTYLQGGWVRAPGNIWYGRYFYWPDRRGMSWGYSAPAIHSTPEWTFAVQHILPDEDGTGSRRKPDGTPYSMALKQWTHPKEAAYLCLFMVSFRPGEVDDHWIIEIKETPPDLSLKPLTP